MPYNRGSALAASAETLKRLHCAKDIAALDSDSAPKPASEHPQPEIFTLSDIYRLAPAMGRHLD